MSEASVTGDWYVIPEPGVHAAPATATQETPTDPVSEYSGSSQISEAWAVESEREDPPVEVPTVDLTRDLSPEPVGGSTMGGSESDIDI